MTGLQVSPETIKRCCAAAYDHAAVRILVGDALHPAGRSSPSGWVGS